MASAHEAQGEYTGCEKSYPRGHDLSVMGEGHAEIRRNGGGEALGGLGHMSRNEGDGYGEKEGQHCGRGAGNNRVRIGAGIQNFCTSCSNGGRRKGREILCPHRGNRCVLLCRYDLELGRPSLIHGRAEMVMLLWIQATTCHRVLLE